MPEWNREILRRLAPLKLAAPREHEIADELSQHLGDRYQELLSSGHSEDSARRVTLEELKGEAPHTVAHRVWTNIPNAISLTRLLATPVLLGAVFCRCQELFKWLLLACLLSDILDGLIARTFDLRSPTGASLDSIADMLVCLIAVAGLIMFQSKFLAAHYVEILIVLGLYAIEAVAAFLRYGKISSFHTVLDRIAAYAQGIFVMSLFLWGFREWIFQPTIVLTVLAYSEELLLLYLLPKWRSDVPGLYWVLSRKEASS